MKLLQGFHSEEAARELQLRLERAGIAIVVTRPVKVRNSGPLSAADTTFSHLVFAPRPPNTPTPLRCCASPITWCSNRWT